MPVLLSNVTVHRSIGMFEYGDWMKSIYGNKQRPDITVQLGIKGKSHTKTVGVKILGIQWRPAGATMTVLGDNCRAELLIANSSHGLSVVACDDAFISYIARILGVEVERGDAGQMNLVTT